LEVLAGLDGESSFGWMERDFNQNFPPGYTSIFNGSFKSPKGLCDHITNLGQKFWRESKNGEQKVAWVSWDSMMMPKYKGGLGFRDIEVFNLSSG
jgi:hypothetical protein